MNDDPPRLPDGHATAGLLAVMMVKDPAQRWPAERVRDDLRRIARGEPQHGTGARRRGTTSRTRTRPSRWSRRARSARSGRADDHAVHAGAGGRRGATPSSTTSPLRPPHRHPQPTPTPASDRSRGLPVGWVAAALALVLVAGLGAWLLWPRDDDPTGGSTADPSASAEPSHRGADRRAVVRAHLREPTSEPTSEEPTTEPSPSNAAGGTPAAMRAFVQDYFSLVTSDPESTFAMLTPEFQADERRLSRATPGSGARSSRQPRGPSRPIPGR